MITSITFDDISPAYLSLSKLRWLINFLEGINISCTLFVVPDEHKSCSATEEFASCLRAALDSGHELSLHGYMHTKNEFGYFYSVPLPIPLPPLRKQKERLERGMKTMINLTGVRPLGFRAPFYLHSNVTLRALSSLNFRYDSSKTVFKPTHGARLRVRWLHDPKPFVIEGVTEIPVTGDYTYNQKNFNSCSSLRRAIRDFEWVKSLDGIFVMNIHLNRLDKLTLSHFLRTFVNKLFRKTNFVRLIDVVS